MLLRTDFQHLLIWRSIPTYKRFAGPSSSRQNECLPPTTASQGISIDQDIITFATMSLFSSPTSASPLCAKTAIIQNPSSAMPPRNAQ